MWHLTGHFPSSWRQLPVGWQDRGYTLMAFLSAWNYRGYASGIRNFFRSKCCVYFFFRSAASATSVLTLSLHLSEEKTGNDSFFFHLYLTFMTSLSCTTEWVDYKMQQLSDQLCYWGILAACRKKQLLESHTDSVPKICHNKALCFSPQLPACFNYPCAGDKEWLKMKEMVCSSVMETISAVWPWISFHLQKAVFLSSCPLDLTPQLPYFHATSCPCETSHYFCL